MNVITAKQARRMAWYGSMENVEQFKAVFESIRHAASNGEATAELKVLDKKEAAFIAIELRTLGFTVLVVEATPPAYAAKNLTKYTLQISF